MTLLFIVAVSLVVYALAGYGVYRLLLPEGRYRG